MRNALVVAEIAIALVVLIGAGLLLRTFQRLQQVDLGFDTRNALTASVELPDARYPKPEQATAFYRLLLDRVKALPGVEAVSAITPLPLSGSTFVISFEVEGRNIPKGQLPSSHFRAISPEYFSVMKIPLTRRTSFHQHVTMRNPPAS